jgi:hypothetical protein
MRMLALALTLALSLPWVSGCDRAPTGGAAGAAADLAIVSGSEAESRGEAKRAGRPLQYAAADAGTTSRSKVPRRAGGPVRVTPASSRSAVIEAGGSTARLQRWLRLRRVV